MKTDQDRGLGWAAAWSIARRDLNASFRGLRLLLACLFLGVGALAAIGTLTGAIEGELKSRGQTILGGDVQVEVWQRGATAAERTELEKFGQVSGGVRLQAMASSGETVVPIELKQRADKVTDGEIADDVTRNAPETQDHFYVVPRVVE